MHRYTLAFSYLSLSLCDISKPELHPVFLYLIILLCFSNFRECASTLYLGLVIPFPLVWYKTKIQIYQLYATLVPRSAKIYFF